MVAYSFKARFEEPIITGRKTHTLRNERRRHARVGEDLQLYRSMRTKQCKLLLRARCDRFQRAHLFFESGIGSSAGVIVHDLGPSIDDITGWEERLPASTPNPDAFAISDGFKDFDDMARFWWDEHKTREWRGYLIGWEFPK
ncbi:MAG: ASCH domain-containing protein [Desulfurellales bacterium]|nr:MAG: ASCH domain-containing protein [Desulfurellales bacterium]